MSLETQLIKNSGPTEVQLTYTNATGSSISITNHEVFPITSDSGKRIAAVAWADTDVATPGTCADGETMQVLIGGRVRVDKDTAVSFTQGITCFWDASANKASNAATAATMSDFALGRVVKIAATAATEVDVDLNEGPGAFSLGSSSSCSSSSSSSTSA